MMLTTSPYLRIRRPSPTAAEFTVSTLPPQTLGLRLTLLAINLLRAVLTSAIFIFLYATWLTQNPFHNKSPTHPILTSPPFTLAITLARTANPRVAVPLCLAAIYALTRPLHTEESLLVLRGLGIQTRSSHGGGSLLFPGWWGATTTRRTRFIPTEKIRDVLVNEAFRGFEVRYYLVVVVEGEQDVIVVFPSLLPRAAVVERVWRGVRECLYDQPEGGGRRVNGKC